MAETGTSNVLVHSALVLSQFVAASSSIVTQVTLQVGVDKLVLGFYSLLLAACILLVVSWVFERKQQQQQDVRLCSVDILLRLLILGFMCFALQILFLVGIENTSANFVASVHPISPVFTAISAVIFGVESLNWRRHDGQAKVLGIIICALGAATLPLYEGPCLAGRSCNSNSRNPAPAVATQSSLDLGLTPFQLGALCVVLANLCTGVLGSFVAKLLVKCPTPATILAFTFAIAATITGTIAVATTIGDLHAWSMPPRAILVIILNGAFSLTLFPFLLLRGVMKLGPTIVSCYTPANPIFTTLLSLAFLGSSVYLGNIIGAALLIVGLCLVSWAEEEHLKLKGIRNSADLEEALVQEQTLN